MGIQLREMVGEDGSHPCPPGFEQLDARAAAKVTAAKVRLDLGHTPNMSWFRGIGEYQIDWRPVYRIDLANEGNALIVLFGGSTKKNPQKAGDLTVALHDEYTAK
ncbi:MAG: type II toxin-antitoxin system RelE/ParE family toxin [Hydrogenophaga sp.]|uniref:type II toxin-antitoxin system RelE/ParE family toxin n=1 Tax=Hydrogenophaga sp. TaxID=1904254 RepID=UPI002724F2CB|nr:type II toxin-antitoxin system RelE/ParE family toxin [Hydrogenophaga sp.]MDO9146755.1 type II toxin-antitoxin system RelE/ParE family toxin [Hydrogenophaga sp.]MDO9603462.1 type II toxin-antitoxin system RelE/ParE family toxin [Hydrogenophaga sp.]